jgi:hypothetical protein
MQTLEHRRLAGRHPGDALNGTFAGVTDTVVHTRQDVALNATPWRPRPG